MKILCFEDYEIEIIQKALQVYVNEYFPFGSSGILDKGKRNYVSREKLKKRVGFIKRSMDRQANGEHLHMDEMIDYICNNYVLPDEVATVLVDYRNAICGGEYQ